MFKNVSKEELVIPASMNHLKEVRDFIERIGKKYKFSDKIINSFKLVVDEACTNIIRHGYLDIKDGKITIRAIIRRLSLTIVIIDQGKSFDPRQVQNPDLQKYVQIGKKGGLGILMMRKLMDDIQYNITHRGNELRLTKMRDSVEEPRFKNWWETLSLRRKSFYVTSVVVLILGIVTFTTLYMNLRKSLRNDIFLEAGSASQSFARTNWENLRKEQVLLLNENALALRKSHNHLIRRAMITTPGYQVVALSPFKADEINSQINIQEMEKISQRGELEIYRSIQNDSVSYFFLSPIRLETVVAEPIGYAIIEVSEHYINERIAQERNKLLIYFFAILGVAILGLAFLVTRITKPFHKLADWVRKVGHGQVDQDEIDIDSSDELGEIAQAFNEMTTKFREAQLSVIEQQRMQKELQVAQEIQQMLLPDDFPDVLGYDIASYYQSAKEVGGDLFDFMEVDEHSIGICVADVSGKGVPGSLVMTMIRTSLRLEARGNKNPADILTRVNAFVTDDIKKGMFVTMLYVILDSRERMVWFASAGHNPMILYRGKSRETYYLNPSGFPVGITLPDINLFGER
ncbi:MAG: HAMP domain-containing protein, partial [Calditrichaeota bacterium]